MNKENCALKLIDEIILLLRTFHFLGFIIRSHDFRGCVNLCVDELL